MSVPFAACIVLAELNTFPPGCLLPQVTSRLYSVDTFRTFAVSQERQHFVGGGKRKQKTTAKFWLVSDQPLLMIDKSLNICVAQF